MNPLSGVLGESWQLYKTYARHLLTIAFVVYVIAGIVYGVLALVGGIFGALLGELVTIVALFLLTAALVKAVQDVRDGTVNLSVAQTFSSAVPFIGPVAVASILAGIAIAIGLAIIIIPGLFLLTIWSMIIPAIVLGGAGAFASFGRSWQLVRGHFWNVFGIMIVVYLIQFAVGLVLGLIFGALPHLLGSFLSSVISGTLIAPFIAVVITLMYFRLSAVAVGSGAAGGSGSYGSSDPYGPPGPFNG
jgi:hypothetical protein